MLVLILYLIQMKISKQDFYNVLETISSDLWWNREVCQTSK